MANPADVDPTITTLRNPTFLGAHYAAGGRVLDERTRRLSFTLSNDPVPYRGYVQRWSMRIPLIDIDGQLQERLLVHQEQNQTRQIFRVRVPQDPDVSDDAESGTITVNREVPALQDQLQVTLTAPLVVWPRWFFSVPGDDKVYMAASYGPFRGRTPAVVSTAAFFVYPQLRKTIPAGTQLNLWPYMRVTYKEILSEREAVIDRRPVKVIVVNFSEALFPSG